MNNRRTNFDRTLWVLTGLFPGILFVGGNGLVFVSLWGVVWLIGIFRNWGPMIPCMSLGIVISYILALSSSAGSDSEAAFHEFGVPLIGALCGVAYGYFSENLQQQEPLGDQARTRFW